MKIFDPTIYKNRQAYWQSLIGLLCLVLMVAGYVVSRAILSIATVVLFVNAFWPANIAIVWKRFRTNNFGIWAFVFYLICALSYFWSIDKGEWAREAMIQMPFMLLPLGFCSVPFESIAYRRLLFVTSISISILAVLGSLIVFLSNWRVYVANYNLSMPMPTTKTGDHIRFSLWLSLMVLFGFQNLIKDEFFRKKTWANILVWSSIILFIIYIHVLSAKTGLLMLYIILMAIGYYFFSRRFKSNLAKLLPFIIVSIGFAAFYFFIPTFTTKIDYVIGEAEHVMAGDKLNYNLSDHGRLISLDVGFQEAKKTGFWGTGAGDVLDVMKKGYDTKYPEVPMELRFMPFNQYLLSILAYGWLLGLPLFVLSLCPFFKKAKSNAYFINLVTSIMIITMMFEGTLELQTGVFVYLFLTMWTLALNWEESPEINSSSLIFKPSKKP